MSSRVTSLGCAECTTSSDTRPGTRRQATAASATAKKDDLGTALPAIAHLGAKEREPGA